DLFPDIRPPGSVELPELRSPQIEDGGIRRVDDDLMVAVYLVFPEREGDLREGGRGVPRAIAPPDSEQPVGPDIVNADVEDVRIGRGDGEGDSPDPASGGAPGAVDQRPRFSSIHGPVEPGPGGAGIPEGGIEMVEAAGVALQVGAVAVEFSGPGGPAVGRLEDPRRLHRQRGLPLRKGGGGQEDVRVGGMNLDAAEGQL